MKIRILIGKVFGDDHFISIAFPGGRAAVLSLVSNGVMIYDGGKAYRAELKPVDSSDIDFYLPLEGEIHGTARKVVEDGRMFIIVGDKRYEVGKVLEVEV